MIIICTKNNIKLSGKLSNFRLNLFFLFFPPNQPTNNQTKPACTAERCFRVDRAQENLHYVTDIATDVIYVLDQECPTLPQTPENESPANLVNPIISSLESSDKDSHDGTPISPSKKFFNRSLSSGPTSSSRKSSQGSQGSNGSARSSLNASKEDIDNTGNGETANYRV